MISSWATASVAWLAVRGAALLLVNTCFASRRLDKLVIVYWFVIPVALISVGTSKLHHYLYPFLPPLALAAGFGPAWLLAIGAQLHGSRDGRRCTRGGWRRARGARWREDSLLGVRGRWLR